MQLLPLNCHYLKNSCTISCNHLHKSLSPLNFIHLPNFIFNTPFRSHLPPDHFTPHPCYSTTITITPEFPFLRHTSITFILPTSVRRMRRNLFCLNCCTLPLLSTANSYSTIGCYDMTTGMNDVVYCSAAHFVCCFCCYCIESFDKLFCFVKLVVICLLLCVNYSKLYAITRVAYIPGFRKG